MSGNTTSPGSTIVNGLLVFGAVYVGYKIYQCNKDYGVDTVAGLIGCGALNVVEDVGNLVQSKSDEIQCGAGYGDYPKFVASPVVWLPAAASFLGSAFKGKADWSLIKPDCTGT